MRREKLYLPWKISQNIEKLLAFNNLINSNQYHDTASNHWIYFIFKLPTIVIMLNYSHTPSIPKYLSLLVCVP
jgi:hypothetical protein